MDGTEYLHLPIEQLVRRSGAPSQLGFAAEAKALLPGNEDYLLAASPDGLHVLGRNEEALAAPVEILRDAYGARLEIEPPRARRIGDDGQAQEPVMHVRISLDASCAAPVQRALAQRGATLAEEYTRGAHCVLRYEAPAAALLGLPAELARLTGGRATHSMALSRWASVA